MRDEMESGSAANTTISVIDSPAIGSQFNRAASKLTNSNDGNLVDLIELLEKIDTDKPLAKLNETSYSDNNGRRVNF
jgi:hypothetical protein